MKEFYEFVPGKTVVIYQRLQVETISPHFLTFILQAFGYTLSIMSAVLLLFIVWPVVQLELSYRVRNFMDQKPAVVTTVPVSIASESAVVQPAATFATLIVDPEEEMIVPKSAQFGVVIPKIGVNSMVIPDVDPGNPKEYLSALTQGVAHAKGTGLPGEGKMIYIFGHSTDYIWNVSAWNAQFYLLKELEKNDEINVFYLGRRFRYQVIATHITEPSDLSFLESRDSEVLLLQTCYPPGTTLKRLIVEARPIGSFNDLTDKPI